MFQREMMLPYDDPNYRLRLCMQALTGAMSDAQKVKDKKLIRLLDVAYGRTKELWNKKALKS